jgi:hypothetical protein
LAAQNYQKVHRWSQYVSPNRFVKFYLVIVVTDGVEWVCVDPGEKGAIFEGGGPGPARRGKRWAVGFRQWRRIDVAR